MHPALVVFLTIVFIIVLIILGIFSLYFYAINKVATTYQEAQRRPLVI